MEVRTQSYPKIKSEPVPVHFGRSIANKVQYQRLSGELRTWTRPGDSGKDVTNNYCASCNNLMYVDAGAMPNIVIFKPGTLDDKSFLDKLAVQQEVYTRSRPDCIHAFEGAKQAEATSQ